MKTVFDQHLGNVTKAHFGAPLVSIVMPVYNGQAYIEDAIRSVIGQTLAEWELIIIDDGSTDSSLQIISGFTDGRIKVVSQANGGVSSARNIALKMAIGEYITFLDADDILPINSLRARVDFLEYNSDIDLVDGVAYVMDSSLSRVLREHIPSYRGKLLPKLLALDSRVYLTCYYMFRRSALKEVLFNTEMTHSEDILFFIDLAYYSDITYGYVSEPVFIYRVGHSSAMKNSEGLEEGYYQLIRRVNLLKNVDLKSKIFLQLKVMRIMFAVWLAANEYRRAVGSVVKFCLC